MILRRVIAHFRKQEWTAIFLDFLIVVVGVFVGLQVNNWNAARATTARTAKIVAALQRDFADVAAVETAFDDKIAAAFAAYDGARAKGEQPPPVFFRVAGADTPPKSPCRGMLQTQIAELIDPALLWELCFYFDERDGVAEKYVRYVIFVESEILPRLKGEASAFYAADGSLAPAFAANVDRLREWRRDSHRLARWSQCLRQRLNAASAPGPSCRGGVGQTIASEPAAETEP